MINIGTLIDSFVLALRSIPELVTAMGGDATRIAAYHTNYPKRNSFRLAIYQMPDPAILVSYGGFNLGNFGPGEATKHTLLISMRAATYDDSQPPLGQYQLIQLLIHGVPTNGDGQILAYQEIIPECDPMETIDGAAATDDQGIDYFQVTAVFTERGFH